MDWSEYKRLCDRPTVFSRWMLEQTRELIEGESLLADALGNALRGKVLDKPADHRGGSATDMFVLQLEMDQAAAILLRMERAEQNDRRTAATRRRGIGGFVAAWREYLEFLERVGSQHG